MICLARPNPGRALPLAACNDDISAGDGGTGDTGGTGGTSDTGDTGSEDFVDAEFLVRESVKQLHITHAEPGVELRVAFDASRFIRQSIGDVSRTIFEA